MGNWTIVQPSRGSSGHSTYEKYYSQPVIAINSRFEILMTPAAHELLGKPTHVEILHDSRAKMFGLRTASGKDPAFKVQINTTTTKDGSRTPVVRGMLRISSHAPEDYHWGQEGCIVIYRAAMDADGVLVVDLKARLDCIDAPIRHRKNGKK